MKTIRIILTGIAIIALVGVIGCHRGGSTSSTADGTNTQGTGTNNVTTTTTPPSGIAKGTMTKGSVKVNGVEFKVNAETVILADDNPIAESSLDDGMQVKVKGAINDDKINGTAEKVEVVNEVRGAITAVAGDTVTVNGQTVLIDGGTVLANAAGVAFIATGDNVEVHGVRDDAGVIHATRVEKLGAGIGENEVRGVVAGKTATIFTIGGLTITFNSSTVMVPADAVFANGDVVEAHFNGSTATRIVVEHLDHPEFEKPEGQEISVEGILSGFSASGTFKVGAQLVTLSTGTNLRIDGGVLADLIDGMKVEAEGHTVTGGILTAEKITIKDSIRIEANADGIGKADVLGKTVKTTSLVKLSSNLTSTATITAGDGLRIRGFVNRDGATITATRVDKQSNPVDAAKIIIQGPVTSINATAHTFSIMGITVSAGSAIARPNDDKSVDNNALTTTPEAFFASLTEGRSVVKAKGTFISGSPGSLVATEIEIE